MLGFEHVDFGVLHDDSVFLIRGSRFMRCVYMCNVYCVNQPMCECAFRYVCLLFSSDS